MYVRDSARSAARGIEATGSRMRTCAVRARRRDNPPALLAVPHSGRSTPERRVIAHTAVRASRELPGETPHNPPRRGAWEEGCCATDSRARTCTAWTRPRKNPDALLFRRLRVAFAALRGSLRTHGVSLQSTELRSTEAQPQPACEEAVKISLYSPLICPPRPSSRMPTSFLSRPLSLEQQIHLRLRRRLLRTSTRVRFHKSRWCRTKVQRVSSSQCGWRARCPAATRDNTTGLKSRWLWSWIIASFMPSE